MPNGSIAWTGVDGGAPAEGGGGAAGASIPPKTVIVRVVAATPSPVGAPFPFAEIAATHNVSGPFVGGATNPNV